MDRLGNRCHGDMENCAMNAPPAPPPMLLLVDDDPAVLASLIFSLELDGFAVDAFDSGETVVARTRLARHACLVLDYRLAGIDGLSLLSLLRERGETCPAANSTAVSFRDRLVVRFLLIVDEDAHRRAVQVVILTALERPEESGEPGQPHQQGDWD